MAQNSEQIESKLCAYIEGELDERAQAEIERHLEANPHHRKLLSQLAATRKLVQTLPRESAPAELYEMFQSQLERSVLLDYNDGRDEPQVYGRINRYPQVFAAAAIVTLAVGLGAIVYFALPTTGLRPANGTFAVNEEALPAAAAPLPLESPEPTESDRAARDEAVARRYVGGKSASAPSPPPADSFAAPSSAPSLGSLAEKLRNDATGGATGGGIFTERGTRNERLAAEPLVLVVSSTNPGAAEGTLRRALQEIPGVAWAEATPALLGDSAANARVPTDDEKQQLAKKVAEFGMNSPTAPEPAAQTRLLRQAEEVLKRSESPRQAPEAEQVDKLVGSYAKREAEEKSGAAPKAAAPPLPAEQRPVAAAATPAPAPAPAPAPGGPAASAGAKPDAAEPSTRSAGAGSDKPRVQPPAAAAVALRSTEDRDGQRGIPGAAKENADLSSRSLSLQQQSGPSDAGLATAYRVIVAQNVPRSQVEALRRQLGSGSPGGGGSAQQGQQLEQVVVALNDAGAPNPRTDALKADRFAKSQGTESFELKPAPPSAPADAAAAQDAPTASGGSRPEPAQSTVQAKTAAAGSAVPTATAPAGVVAQRGAAGSQQQQQASSALDRAKDRILRKGDVLRLSIAESGKPPVEKDVRIGADGTFALPQSGESVYSEGLTVAELERHVEATIARQEKGAMRPGEAGGGAGGFGAGSASREGGGNVGGYANKPTSRGAPAPDNAGAPKGPRVSIAALVPQTTQPAPAKPAPAAQPDGRTSLAATGPSRPAPAARLDAPAAAASLEPNSVLAERTPADAPAAIQRSFGGGRGGDDTPIDVVFVLRQTTSAPLATAAPVAPAQAAPGGTPNGSPIRDSEILTVTVEDPTSPSTTNVRVAEDGTIDVPKVGKVRALGRAPGEVEYEIESRWRQAHTGANAKVVTKAKIARPEEEHPAASPPPAATRVPPPNR